MKSIHPTRLKFLGLAAAGALLLSAPARADVLTEYTFGGSVLTPASTDANISAGSFGHSITAPGFNTVYFGPSGSPSAVVADTNNLNWGGASLDLTKYFTFTLTIESGFDADFTSLTFYSNRNGGGPKEWEVRYSVDNFGSTLGSGTNLQDVAMPQQTVALSDSNLTGSVEFRIYGYDTGGSTQAFRIDDIVVNGSTSVIPEPSAYALILGGLVTLVMVRRRPARER